MIEAIVYTSQTGFTKKYAEILAEETGVAVYNLEEGKEKVKKDAEIIYMGWIMAGGVKNYNKVKNKYQVKALCAVGMAAPSEDQYKGIVKKYNLQEPLFYLQGGYDKTKLKGMYKFMMNSMEKVIKSALTKKENKTPEELEMLEMMENGKDCVKKENLIDVIDWVRKS